MEKDAGAEILQWRVHVVDELLGSNADLQRVFYHYIRLKIFDEKGVKDAATIDLPHGARSAILDVAGRTIRADGTIVELDRKTIHQRDVVKAGRASQKAVSFAMPGVEPGAIVEYRWKQTLDDNRILYMRLNFQREFPIRKVTYFIKPLPSQYSTYQMMFLPFNCTPTPFKVEDAYSVTSVENIPAERFEPFAPSAPNLAPWALVRYQDGKRDNADKYWNDIGKKQYNELKAALKVTDEIKSLTNEAIAGAANDDAKVAAIIARVRKSVRHINTLSDAERLEFINKLPKDRIRNSGEVLKAGVGTSYDMNTVFGAMALQAGLDARPALVADRGEMMFNPKALPDEYFIDNIDMAVKFGDKWKVYDVSRRNLTPGMLPWAQEGNFALITDPKNPTFIQTPVSSPEISEEARTAAFTLAADGTLQGEITESFSGHRAEDHRNDLFGMSAQQREDWLKERATRMFPDSDATNIVFENVEESGKPLIAKYRLEAPRYAQVTGKRILFQIMALRRAQGSPFTSSERRYPIQFPYAWKESDRITFVIPAGFVLDNADAPQPMNFGEVGKYEVKVQFNKANNQLTVARDLTFGAGETIYFDAKAYPTLKKIFDELRTRDQHAISLKGE